MVVSPQQSFYSVFQDLSGKGVVVSVELKNGLVVQGKLEGVDQHLNFSLFDLNIDTEKFPQFVAETHQATLRTAFIRGSTVRYVHLPATEVDTELVEEAFRRSGQTN